MAKVVSFQEYANRRFVLVSDTYVEYVGRDELLTAYLNLVDCHRQSIVMAWNALTVMQSLLDPNCELVEEEILKLVEHNVLCFENERKMRLRVRSAKHAYLALRKECAYER